MNLSLISAPQNLQGQISIPGSKSESNRLLILQALFADFQIENLSTSDDTQVMQAALKANQSLIDVGHAGTAMRFLTAYFAIQTHREVVLTGSKRMQERPIQILVDALRQLGADIQYEHTAGYPPLRIRGKNLTGKTVKINANVSSQYSSALLLIGAKMPHGLRLQLEGEVTSLPYLEMTISLLKKIGIDVIAKGNNIQVKPFTPAKTNPQSVRVESDWSSVSYLYSLASLSKTATIALSSFHANSLQGDSALVNLYEQFGITTDIDPVQHKISIKKIPTIQLPKKIDLNFANTPDLAQTFVVTCLGLQIPVRLSGLHTLKIKETDRLQALKNELEKFGATVTIGDDVLTMQPPVRFPKSVGIETYNDHRMAMAFAPMLTKTKLLIENSEVVAKSFPEFWAVLAHLGVQID